MPQNHGSVLDKRQETRYPAHRSSILKHNNERFYTTIINFSASGVGFLSSKPLTLGEEVELVFEVDFDNETIYYDIPIMIVRSAADEDEFEYNIGAHLNKVTFEYRQLLKKLSKMHEEFNRYRKL